MQTHNHIEAVIFDWAGTTVDYGCFAPVQVFTEVFTNAGVAPTPQEVREPMGMLKWDHIRTMLEMPRIKREWIRLYGQAPLTQTLTNCMQVMNRRSYISSHDTPIRTICS